MGLLKNEYKSFLNDIDKNIKNKDDLEYIKKRFSEFMDVVLKSKKENSNDQNDRIDYLEKRQNELEAKLKKVQTIIDNIENDIYANEGFDFEITCPYCNYDFFIDVDEEKTEVKCPKCKKTIELDWNGNPEDDYGASSFGCNGNCNGCSGCGGINLNSDEDDDM